MCDKTAEGCIVEILRVSGQETIEKNINGIQGPSLAIVLEKNHLNLQKLWRLEKCFKVPFHHLVVVQRFQNNLEAKKQMSLSDKSRKGNSVVQNK
ncbi:unnamed protein product [Arabidopsis halleri]